MKLEIQNPNLFGEFQSLYVETDHHPRVDIAIWDDEDIVIDVEDYGGDVTVIFTLENLKWLVETTEKFLSVRHGGKDE
jgi:hypothetical protein